MGGNKKCRFCQQEKGKWLHFLECPLKPLRLDLLERETVEVLKEAGTEMNIKQIIEDIGLKKLAKQLA